MSSPQGFHAKTSVSLENAPGFRASLRDYGLTSPDLFVKWDRDSCCWKTAQVSLFGGLEKFSGTWPSSGMTRNGIAYRLRPLAPITYELASGFWPTPLASETGWRRTRFAQGGCSLSFALGGYPNPVWVEWLSGFPLKWTELD